MLWTAWTTCWETACWLAVRQGSRFHAIRDCNQRDTLSRPTMNPAMGYED